MHNRSLAGAWWRAAAHKLSLGHYVSVYLLFCFFINTQNEVTPGMPYTVCAFLYLLALQHMRMHFHICQTLWGTLALVQEQKRIFGECVLHVCPLYNLKQRGKLQCAIITALSCTTVPAYFCLQHIVARKVQLSLMAVNCQVWHDYSNYG